MFKDFLTQKSKISQEGEGGEEGNEIHLGLPCGRQKFLGHFEVEARPSRNSVRGGPSRALISQVGPIGTPLLLTIS